MTPAEALAAMTEHEGRLRALLEQFEPAALIARPANGDWSALENIRHLLYAEQHHLGRCVPGGLQPSALGLPQGRFAAVTGADPRTDFATVFGEWERVHAAICSGIDLVHPWLLLQLPRMFRHQQAHGRLAARALGEATGQSVRLPSRR